MDYLNPSTGITMRRRRKHNPLKRTFTIFFFLIIIITGIIFWWNNETSPVNINDSSIIPFVVNKGDGTRQIAQELKTQGLIKDPLAFFLLIRLTGIDGKLQAGDFRLSPSMSDFKIAQLLQVGTFDIYVTIPEGKRADEIADILKAKIPSYQPTWRALLDAKEGYLFPDTYSFPKNATISLIINTMTNNFNQKYASIPNNANTKFNQKDIVTIASIVEREAKFAQDRPLVASVIINRLNVGMPLEIDATVQYALGYQQDEGTWWKPDLTALDLQVDSPFNTYVNTGLPPTPISNPGIQSLSAVIHAPQTNYLFYISDKYGHNHYEVTSDQHEADMVKYGLIDQ